MNFPKKFTCPSCKLRTGFTILALLQNPLALGYWTWFFLHAVYYPHPSINAVPVSTGYQICHPLCAKYIDIKVKSFLKSFSQEENKQPSIQDIIELFLCSLLVLNHIRDQKLDAMTRHVWIFLKLSLLVYSFLNNNIVIIPKPVIHLETSTSCSESLDMNTYSYLTVSPQWSKFSSNHYEFLHSFLRQQFAGKPVVAL